MLRSWQTPSPDEAQIAAEFADFLRKGWTEIRIGDVNAERIELILQGGVDAKLFLHKLHGTIAELPRNNAKTRQIYESFARHMLADDKQVPAFDKLDAAQMVSKIFPRVVRPDMFRSLQGKTAKPLQMPQRPLPGTDFVIVYVLDFGDRVAYVAEQQVESLDKDEDALFRHSMDNARTLFSREDLHRTVAQFGPKKVAHFIDCPDGHAGARLLVLPEYLDEDDSLAALIMGNNLFLLALIPPTNNWNPLRQAARQAKSPHLHQPFLVTPAGIKAM